MSFTKREAFVCDECKKIFLTEKGAVNCIERHKDKVIRREKAREAAEQAKLEREEKERARHTWRDSITSFEQVADAICQIGDENGYDITCEISGRLGLSSYSHSRPIGFKGRYDSIDARQNPNKYRRPAFNGRIKGTYYDREERRTFTGSRIYFGDFLSSKCPGVYTDSGSGGEKFEYNLTLWLEDFPKIAEQYEFLFPIDTLYDRFQGLIADYSDYTKEKSRLSKQYDQEILPFRLIADSTWLFYDSEIKDKGKEILKLRQEIDDLLLKRAALEREHSSDREEYIKPDETLDLDFDRLNKIAKFYNSWLKYEP